MSLTPEPAGVAQGPFFPGYMDSSSRSTFFRPGRVGAGALAPAVVSRRSVPGRKRASGHNQLVHRGGRRVTREGRNVSGAAALARLDAAPVAVALRADDSEPRHAGENEDTGRRSDCGPISGLSVGDLRLRATMTVAHRGPVRETASGAPAGNRPDAVSVGPRRHVIRSSPQQPLRSGHAATNATSRVQTAQTSRASLLATATMALLK